MAWLVFILNKYRVTTEVSCPFGPFGNLHSSNLINIIFDSLKNPFWIVLHGIIGITGLGWVARRENILVPSFPFSTASLSHFVLCWQCSNSMFFSFLSSCILALALSFFILSILSISCRSTLFLFWLFWIHFRSRGVSEVDWRWVERFWWKFGDPSMC